MSGEDFYHQPVLVDEVLQGLALQAGGLYIDATVGGGGHSLAMLQACPQITLLGIDQDDEALAAAARRLQPCENRVKLYYSNFSQLTQALAALGYQEGQADGVLLDIGVSSHQLDEARRGFSYMQEAPLDMRMDQSRALTAAEIVNRWPEQELQQIFFTYGEERWAKRIAAFIVQERALAPIETTLQLVSVIKKAVPKGAREPDQHPAKRVFQSLRVVVNAELEALEQGLEAAKRALKSGGRLAVITFQSLEDRIVKDKFRLWASGCICDKSLPVCVCGHQPEVRIITRRPLTATERELAQNPRARSAKLRVAEKL